MKKGLAAAVVAVAILLLAGCLAGPAGPDYTGVRSEVRMTAAQVLRLDHDAEDGRGHYDAKLHQGAHNVQLVGYSNGFDDSGDPNKIPRVGTYNELAVVGHHAYLVAQSGDGSYGGFSIINIADPAKPHVVSRFVGQGGADIEVNPEETLAFVATQRNTVEQLAGAMQVAPETAAGARGIYIVDIADKAAPTMDSFFPLPYNGPHTLTFHRHANGSDYLLVCTYDLIADPVTGGIASAFPVTQRLIVYLIAPSPAAEQGAPGPQVALLPVAQYQITDMPPDGKLYFPHDATAGVHPTDSGKTIITLAYWDKGVRFLDFSDPPSPTPAGPPGNLREIGGYTEFAPSAFNNIHYAKAFPSPIAAFTADRTVAPRHVTVAEPEIISAPDETGQITFLDSTDPSNPTFLGHWTLPPQTPPLGVSGLDFSPHNFDLWDGKVALGHNHAGVWIIDVSTPENLEDPAEVGYYMTAKPRGNSPTLQPRVWGVVEEGGLLYVSDEATGLYVLRYTGP